MKPAQILKFITVLFILLFAWNACQKDQLQEPVWNDSQSDIEFKLQAEQLISLLPSELYQLIPVQVWEEFKSGPSVDLQHYVNRKARTRVIRARRSWHPVLASHQFPEDSEMAEGGWYGHGTSTLRLPTVETSGSGSMTDAAGNKLNFSFLKPTGAANHDFDLTATTGTGILFQPEGTLKAYLFHYPNPLQPKVITIGWIYYGLDGEPVPPEFNDFFTEDEILEQYIFLQNNPQAKAVYSKTTTDAWIYPTEIETNTGIKIFGQGTWMGNGEAVFLVDQVNDAIAGQLNGRSRLYQSGIANYREADYIDFCHTAPYDPTAQVSQFSFLSEISGGSGKYMGNFGTVKGVFTMDAPVLFGLAPPTGTFPFEFIDNGAHCTTYGSTDCMGLCDVPGDVGHTTVYLMGYRMEPEPEVTTGPVSISYVDAPLHPEVTINLPGETITGFGALPFEITLGDYTGHLSSAVTGEKMTDQGLRYTLVHYFDDGQGNTFWTRDVAIALPIDATSVAIEDYLTVAGGTGDFTCCYGNFKNVVTLDFVSNTLSGTMTGEISADCH